MTNDNNSRTDCDKRIDYETSVGVNCHKSVDSDRRIHSVKRTEDNSTADSYKKISR
jgi:hypothetical protein